MGMLSPRYAPLLNAYAPFLTSDRHLRNLCYQGDTAPKANAGNAFEDVLYGSDSDAEEHHSDDETPRTAKQRGSGGNPRTIAGGQKAALQRGKSNAPDRSETRIRADDDEPMDLLHSGAANAVGE
jgi:ribosomal RNA-processing protein 12